MIVNIRSKRVIRIDNQLHLEPILKMLDFSGYKWADGVNLLDWQIPVKCYYLFVHANYTVTWTCEDSCYDYANRYDFCTSTKMLLDTNYSVDTDIDSDLKIKKVIFNEPATIIFWNDGTKTIVKCQEGDVYDKEKGFAMCITKKFFGNKSNFNNVMKEWIKE